MARRANSIHPGIMIGFAVLVLGCGILGFIAYDINKRLEIAITERDTATELEEKARAAESAILAKYREELRFLYGWGKDGTGAKNTKADVERFMLDKFAERITTSTASDEARLKDLLKQKLTVLEYTMPTDELNNRVKKLEETHAEQMELIRQELAQAGRDKVALEEAHKSQVDEKDSIISNTETQLGQTQTELDSVRTEYADYQEEMSNNLSQLQVEHQLIVRELKAKIVSKENQVRELEAKFTSGQFKQAQLVPDGEVIDASSINETGTVFINLGQKDRISRGMIFEVFNWGPGGAQVHKGRVVVRSVFEHTSKVGVLELVDAMDPIVVGDLIGNIVYDGNTQKTFVLLGSFEDYSKNELARLIEKEGGKVVSDIDGSVDYVVIGGDVAENKRHKENSRFQRAKDLHLNFMNEAEIRIFLRNYSN